MELSFAKFFTYMEITEIEKLDFKFHSYLFENINKMKLIA